MIRRTLILCSVLLAAVCLGAGAAAPARAASPNAQMRDALMAIRGLIDREGASRYFTYPFVAHVRAGRASYTLRLHRALKRDYVLLDAAATGAWQRLFANLFVPYAQAPAVAMLTVHLPSGAAGAGGLAPSPPAPGSGSSGP